MCSLRLSTAGVLGLQTVRLILPWLGLWFCSCSASVFIQAPADQNAETIVLVWAEPGAERQASVFRSGTPLLFEREFDTLPRVLWLGYAETLDELRLSEGPMPLPAASERGRPAPEAARALLSESGDAFAPLSKEALRIEPLWHGLRFPPFGALECLELGGCPRADGCELPCEPVSFELPHPELPRADCPAGWTAGTVPSLSALNPAREPQLAAQLACRPTLPAEDCEAGTAAFGTGTSCEVLGDCTLEWANDLEADAVFVRSGVAPGGDGTRLAPFATLREARTARPNARHYAIHGRLALDEALQWPQAASSSLRGACATRDGLSFVPGGMIRTPEAGALAVSGLRLTVPAEFVAEHPFVAWADTRLELTNVDLRTLAPVDAIVSLGATVVLERVRVTAPAATHVAWLDSVSTLDAEHVSLEGGTEQTLLAYVEGASLRGALRMKHVTLRSAAVGLFALGYTVTATALTAQAEIPLLLQQASYALNSVYLRPEARTSVTDGPRPVSMDGDTRIRGMWVEPTPEFRYSGFVFGLRADDAWVEDLIVDASGAADGFIVEGGRFEGRRILSINGQRLGGISSVLDAHLEDIVTVGSDFGLALATPALGVGVAQVSSALAVGFRERGIRDTSPPNLELILRGIEARDGTGHGIALRDASNATIEDVIARNVSAGTATVDFPGSCINLRGSLQAKRVQAMDCEMAGLFLEFKTEATLRSVSIENAKVAVVSEEPEAALLEPWMDGHVCGVEHILVDTNLTPVTVHSAPGCTRP